MKYITDVVEPPIHPPISTTNPGVLLCDGVGVHCNVNFLRFCAERGWKVVLRIPWTSEITPNEDLVNLWEFKDAQGTGYYVLKQKIFPSVVAAGRTSLNDVDAMKCIKPAWEHAFSPPVNARAWRLGGLSPFTRRPFWKLLHQEQEAAKLVSTHQAAATARGEIDYSALRAPWQTSARNDADADDDDDSDDDVAGDHYGFLGSARLNSGDLALLRGGANGEEGLKLASLKSECHDIKAMSAKVLEIECGKHGIEYKTKAPATLALLEWVCNHYSTPLPRMWLTKDLCKIKYPADAEAEAMAAAAAVKPRRELGSGLVLARTLAARMAPYDATLVRPASAMPESPSRTARREALDVGGASTTAAGNGGDASDSPPRQRRREDVRRSAEKSEVIAELKAQSVRDGAVLADLRMRLSMLQSAGAEDDNEHEHGA